MWCLPRLSSQVLKQYQRKQVITSAEENPKKVICCASVVGELEEQDRAYSSSLCHRHSGSVAAGVQMLVTGASSHLLSLCLLPAVKAAAEGNPSIKSPVS